jgi:hypothetical protein
MRIGFDWDRHNPLGAMEIYPGDWFRMTLRINLAWWCRPYWHFLRPQYTETGYEVYIQFGPVRINYYSRDWKHR